MLTDFIKKKQSFFVLIFFLFFWFCLLSISGTLTSGYHLTDNHEFVKLNIGIQHEGFCKTLYGTEKYFLQFRFAPVIFFMRILMIQLFHLSFLKLSICWLLVTIVTSWFLFRFSYNIGFRRTAAILFALFIQVGPQAVMSWKLGLAETWGLLFFSIALWFLSMFYLKEKKLYDWFFLFFILVSAACKESFYIIGPVAVLVRLYLISKKQKISIIELLNQSKVFLVIFFSYYFFHFFIAFIVIGINNIPGAFKAELNLIKWAAFLARNLLVKIIVVGLILLLVSRRVKFTFIKDNIPLRNLILIGVLCLIIIIPQLFIYSNLGITERYYVPFSIGLSLVMTYFLDQLYDKKWLYSTYLGILILGLTWQTRIAYISAKEFANEGKSSNIWIKKAIENTKPESNILLVTEPLVYSEWNNSIQIYLNLIGNRKNLYSTEASTSSGIEKAYINKQLVNSYYNTYNLLYKNMKFREQSSIPDIQCILIFPSLEQDFLNQNKDWFRFLCYNRIESGDFVMYSKK